MFAKTKNPVTRAFLRYNIELGGSMLLYTLAMAVRGNLLYGPLLGPIRDPSKSLRTTLALMPVVPIIAVFASVIRLILGVDERVRRQILDSLAISGGITALLAAGYGLLEDEVVPRPSAWWTWAAFMGSWLVISLIGQGRSFVQSRFQ